MNSSPFTKEGLLQLINEVIGKGPRPEEFQYVSEGNHYQISSRVQGDLASLPAVLEVITDDNLCPDFRMTASRLLQKFLSGDLENVRLKWQCLPKDQRVSTKQRVLGLIYHPQTSLNLPQYLCVLNALTTFLADIACAEPPIDRPAVVDEILSLADDKDQNVARSAMVAVVHFAKRICDRTNSAKGIAPGGQRSGELAPYFLRLLDAVAKRFDCGDDFVELEARDRFMELVELTPDGCRAGLSAMMSALLLALEAEGAQKVSRCWARIGCAAALFRANSDLAKGVLGTRAIELLIRIANDSSSNLFGAQAVQLAVDLGVANPPLVAPHLGVLLKAITAIFCVNTQIPDPEELLFTIVCVSQLVDALGQHLAPFANQTVDQLLELLVNISEVYDIPPEEFMPQIFIAVGKLIKCDPIPRAECIPRAQMILTMSSSSISPTVSDEVLFDSCYAMQRALDLLNLFDSMPDDEVAGILRLLEGFQDSAIVDNALREATQQVIVALFRGGE